MDNQEKDFLDDVDTDTSVRKPKKQCEQKLQHLRRKNTMKQQGN